MTNLIICAVIVAAALVGFNGAAVTVSDYGDNVYYRGTRAGKVSLMFNVYGNTQNVYKILDVLDEYDASATFFIGGCWADDNVSCLREIYSRGHELASHGYFHKDHAALTYEQNISEIEPSVCLIRMVCGAEVGLFAPPSGSFGQNTVNACVKLDLKVIMWSKDTIDWRDKDEDVIFRRATEQLTEGDFILMHPEDATLRALPKILGYIRNSGLAACTVSCSLGE